MTTPSRLWLCGMTGFGKEANLRALIEPIKSFFVGLNWTCHYPLDEAADYLESVQGAGRIAFVHYSGRHHSSMNQYLHQGLMQEGDYFIQIDDLERLSVSFCRDHLPRMVAAMEAAPRYAMIANWGKGLLFRFNEQLEFKGSPHWYATGLDGPSANVELGKDLFWNVRDEQRDPFHWVGHYARYFLGPAGSNHALLGLDHHPGGPAVFPEREAKRLAFRQEMRARGFPLTLDGLTAFMGQPLDDHLKGLINSDKTWSDYYWYVLKGDRTVVHSHKPSDAKVVS